MLFLFVILRAGTRTPDPKQYRGPRTVEDRLGKGGAAERVSFCAHIFSSAEARDTELATTRFESFKRAKRKILSCKRQDFCFVLFIFKSSVFIIHFTQQIGLPFCGRPSYFGLFYFEALCFGSCGQLLGKSQLEHAVFILCLDSLGVDARNVKGS